MRSFIVPLLAIVALGCGRDTPNASVAPSAHPTASAGAAVPVHDLVLKIVATPERAADGEAVQLSLAVENRASVRQKIAYFRPLGFQLAVSEPSTGRAITVGIPATDIPVERVEVTLAPGETRTLGGSTLWFDDTGKLRGGMFDWTVQTRPQPLKLVAKLSIEIASGDGGSVMLEATALSA